MNLIIIRIAMILLYIFVYVDSAPYKSGNDVLDSTNNFPGKRSRINRDISFGFPSLGFQIRNSFPVTNVLDVFGVRKNENDIPTQQELKSETNIPNYGQLTKAVDEEPTISKEIIKEVEIVDFYTPIATTTEYMSNTETEASTTEDYALSQRSEVAPAVLSSLLGR
ncbi:hypothetical protein K1T71_004511 [Dendrolimus kikuchii]|uniref:Uncharacterized protein n=1 Tax=Dendrolimus kikuchii TaxID=765133 RepID=A0ACC1D7V7_9NEOP|nr:hypothetical protein K1T71_004511 [Dendrolimus kikuchii]